MSSPMGARLWDDIVPLGPPEHTEVFHIPASQDVAQLEQGSGQPS